MKFSSLLLLLPLITSLFLPLHAEIASEDTLPQSNNLVKAGNKYVTLLGNQVEVGDKAPNFSVVNDTFSPIGLNEFSGKTVLISALPSLDTGVCSLQTKRFNEEVVNLSDNIVILTISNDLPFAQKRFCKVENIDKVKVFSDSVWRDFGKKYGLLIKDMGLLTRAIFIIDAQGKIAYKELVTNIASHPDYDMALATLRALSPTSATLKENSSQAALQQTFEQSKTSEHSAIKNAGSQSQETKPPQ